ncbi:D-alanyl-D-alanine carboxypeptidase/D-alanyl-D-alanine-endopeptidase [Pseudoduganella sp. GCM10020061]|uniref:D-alanyl-D-alanine carboxypeptidase/D-alanyl-D-alanine endopeptidase n=1 Tax=Pseudoduganella sp. GCM10020061 TaxID=3317345 RepID=UPI003629F4FB
MPIRRIVAAVLFAWLPAAHAGLPAPVAEVLSSRGIPEESVSAFVIRDDTIVLDHLADRARAPASTMKMVTTAAALDLLGPVFRARTELLAVGDVKAGVLEGDLVLRGGADLDLSPAALEKMMLSLRNQGIRRIAGKMIVDRSLFNPARLDAGVPPFDEYPDAYYNVIPDAVIVNGNLIEVDMRSTGAAMKLAMWPALEGVSIASEMELIDAPCAKWEDGWKTPEVRSEAGGKLKVVLRGTFPKYCDSAYQVNVIDRQEYTGRAMQSAWKRVGGVFKGEVVEGKTPETARVLAEHTSRMLPELVRDTNKTSDNLFARTLYLALGSLESDPVRGSRPIAGAETQSTLVRADASVRAWMRSNGIGDDGLVIENGSGLSRLERITPIQMAGVLRAASNGNWLPELQASMPIAGVDGTLRRRLKGTPAAQRARLKTGTLKDVVALAGYVPDAAGRTHIVVVMVNDERVGNGNGRAITDALVEWVARQGTVPSGPSPVF